MTIVTQYDVELFQRIEQLIGIRMEKYPCEEAEVLRLQERVVEAQRQAIQEMKQIHDKKREGNARVCVYIADVLPFY